MIYGESYIYDHRYQQDTKRVQFTDVLWSPPQADVRNKRIRSQTPFFGAYFQCTSSRVRIISSSITPTTCTFWKSGLSFIIFQPIERPSSREGRGMSCQKEVSKTFRYEWVKEGTRCLKLLKREERDESLDRNIERGRERERERGPCRERNSSRNIEIGRGRLNVAELARNLTWKWTCITSCREVLIVILSDNAHNWITLHMNEIHFSTQRSRCFSTLSLLHEEQAEAYLPVIVVSSSR